MSTAQFDSKKTIVSITMIATAFSSINNPNLDSAFEEIENALSLAEMATKLKAILPDICDHEEDTLIMSSVLMGCLSKEFVTLRQVNRPLANRYKANIEEAIATADMNKLCDALAVVDQALNQNP
ncbi:MAG: hypothetical protein CMF61_02290 [Magnetococcales bacterium]|nr:hypothetical protein [Magnetococcales bacterium]PPR19297.1 MAG: hypothetical protein CFH43_00263 [Pseudomonadota bacterium]